MRKTNCDFNSSFVSEPGTFITNKSYFAFVELDDLACWVAADGLDSDEEKASAQLVVHRIFENFMEHPTLSRFKIRQYLQNAHNLLQTESRNVRLKAGLIMLVTDYSKIVWAVAGNARLYHFRRGIYNFRSKDQSLAQLMVDSGKLDESEINEHEEHNNLINYLGKSSGFKPFVSRPYRLADGDIMLLCNSGFWENMTTEELVEVLPDSKTAEEFVDNLEELLLSKQNEVLNNYTIAAVYANRVFKENTIDYASLAKRAAMVVIPMLLMLGIGLAINHRMETVRAQKELLAKRQLVLKQQKTMNQHEQNGDQYVSSEKFQEAAEEYQKALEIVNSLNNSAKQAVLQRKNEISMLVVAGDNFYTSEEFQKAYDSYVKANKAANSLSYDQKGIRSRIAKAKNMIEVNNLIKQGDAANLRHNYTDAKEKYQLARGIAEQLSAQAIIARIDAKLNTIEQRRSEEEQRRREENERNKSIYQAKRLEKAGDDQYNQKKYKEALEYYQLAKRAYEGLGLTQDIIMVDQKIKNTEKRTRGIINRIFN